MSDDFYPPEPDFEAISRFKKFAFDQYEKARSGDVYAIDECLRIFGERLSQLYNEEIAREAWRLLKNLAKTDNRALYLLGVRNLFGHPFGRLETKGVSQILLAAEKGNRAARYDVALWHMHGMCGITKDLQLAKTRLTELAEEGMADAQETLDVISYQEKAKI
jgi:TPR repeat protein